MAPVDVSDATKNWLKAALALKHLKNGLLPFVDNQIATVHNNLKATHGICNRCTTENVLKCPTTNVCRKGRYGICQYHDNGNPLKQSRPCPIGVCDNIRDAISREHFKGEPMWKNTDATKWSSDAWEVAKCFLPPGSSQTTSSAHIDCTGLLTLCLLCQPVTALVVHVKGDIEKNRDNRNTLMHSGRQELSAADRSSFIQDAIRLLSTYQIPVSQHTQDCIATLNQIDANGLVLTRDDVLTVVEDKVEAIRIKQEELDVKLQESNEHTVDNAAAIANHQTKLDSYKNDIKQLDVDLKATNSILQRLEETDVKQLQDKMEHIRKQNENFGKQINQQIETLELKVKHHDVLHKEHAGTIKMHDKSLKQHDERHEEHEERHKQHEERHKQHEERHKQHDKRHKYHDERHKEHEDRHKELKQQMMKQETTVDQKLDAVETRVQTLEVNKMRTDADEVAVADRQDAQTMRGRTRLRDFLIKKYKKNYSDVLVAPPKLDMWTDISKHYCKQDMKQVNMNGESQNSKGEEERNIEVRSYNDIFFRKGKQCHNIYIKGDAGSGKSVFCQHMANRWCEIHSTARAEDSVSVHDTIPDELKDIEMLSNFDFLFYITLRHATNIHDIESMIKQNVLRNNKALLDRLTDVLENESEKCLILLDGLDEWSPPVGSTESPFVTSGLPDRDDSYDWTILTATRPCQLETIRPKPCEIDQLIELSGLTGQSVDETISSVVGYLNNRYSKDENATKSPEECSEYLHENISSHIMTLPIILKHLVCIWFEDGHVGKSRCEMYAAMVDLYLRYADLKASQNTLSHCDTATKCNDLPTCLRNRETCQRLKLPLFKLSKIAFHTLFSKDRSSSLVFESHTADMHGMTNSEVDMWLAIGLLSQDSVDTRSTKNEKMISFPHKTIQEFLAAVYMSMHRDPDGAVLPTVKDICGTVDMVLEMSQVFVFLSGMAPTIVTTVSRYISQVVSADGDIQRYRSTVTDKYSNETRRVEAIQQMMVDCIRESFDTGQTNIQVHIQDMIINDRGYINSVLSKLSICNIKEWFKFNKSKLVSFTVQPQCWNQLKTVMGDMSKLAQIAIDCGHYSDDNNDVVVSIITNSKNTLRAITLNGLSFHHSTSKHLCIFQSLPCLRELSLDTVAFNLHQLERIQKLQALYLEDITCTHCSGPYQLDLSQLIQLQRLTIRGFRIVAVQINASQLEHCVLVRPHIFLSYKYVINSIAFHGDCRVLQTFWISCVSMPHEQLEQILLFVKQFTQLREITLNDIRCSECCTDCTCRLDLSQHTELEKLELEKLHVSECRLDLSQHTQLEKLELEKLHVSECRLDLSQYTQLEKLTLQELHVSEVQINTTRLEQCRIHNLRPASSVPNEPGSAESSLMFHGDGRQLQYLILTNIVMKHEQLEQLMLFVTRATRLCQIILSDIKCSECSTDCTCRLDLSQHTQLRKLTLQKLHVSEVQINTTRLEHCIIDSLRPTSSAPNGPGSEEISLMFHGDGSLLLYLTLTNIVMKHEQFERLMLFVTRATRLCQIILSDIKCSECGTGCTCRLDMSQHTQLEKLTLQKLHVSKVQINTTRLERCRIDSLRPASSAPNEPGSEEISLKFRGDGRQLWYITLTNIVMKHEHLEQLMLFVTRATGLREITLNDRKCSECCTDCTCRLDLSQHTQLRELVLQKLHVSEVQIYTTRLEQCIIDSLRPASSAPNEPGSEEISLMFHGNGSLLQYLTLTHIVMKHDQLEQLMLLVTRSTRLRQITLNDIRCSECCTGCTWRLDLSQHTQLRWLELQKLHVSEVQIYTTRLEQCIIDSLRPASSAPNEPGSEEISLMFHGNGSLLQYLTLTHIVMKHDQLEQLMLLVTRSTRLRQITLNDIRCSECCTGCTCRLDLSQHTQLEKLTLQKLHVSEVQIYTTRLDTCTIDNLRPTSIASNEPGSEEISLVFHGDGNRLRNLTLTNIVMKQKQLEQLMMFVKRATRLRKITLNAIKCSECGTVCTCRLDLSQHTQLEKLTLQKLHVSEVQINTTRLEGCTIDSLRPASSASNEPGSEEISLMFHGDGRQLVELILTNIVMKHDQLEQLMLFVTRATGLTKITLNEIKYSECSTYCTCRLDLSQHTRLERLKIQKLHVSEVQINTTLLWRCTIDSLRPASSASNGPGSEEILLMFHGDGSRLQYLRLTNIVMKHEQLEQLMLFVKTITWWSRYLEKIKCSNCGSDCPIQFDIDELADDYKDKLLRPVIKSVLAV